MKNKIIKFFIPIGALSISVIPLSVISCNMSVGYAPAIYNYEDYISPEGEEILGKNLNYKMFGDLPEFEQAIKLGKIVGGIGSDFYNVKLIKQGYLKKLDFHKALHIDKNKKISDELKKIYTKKVWDQMALFDKHIGDADSDGINDHLWEYMLPYFTQSKVVVFNMARGHWSPEELQKLNDADGVVYDNNYSKTKQQTIENMVSDHSFKGILNFLKSHGYDKFINNDYARDNLMIGSESTSFTGNLTNQNYKRFTDDYISLIENSLDVNFRNDVVTEISGVESLDHLLKPNEDWNIAFLYNGDAQYAHIGGSIENEEEGANIRYFTPKNNIFLLDGFVLSSRLQTNGKLENQVYESMYKAVFEGGEQPLNNITDETPAFINYDYVGYTTPFNSIYDYVAESGPGGYFENDFVGYNLLETAEGIDENQIMLPVDDELQNKFWIYYDQKTKG